MHKKIILLAFIMLFSLTAISQAQQVVSDQELILIKASFVDEPTRVIKLTNTGTADVKIGLGKTGLTFLNVFEQSFVLGPHEDKLVNVQFKPIKPGISAGRIVFSAQGPILKIPVVSQVDSLDVEYKAGLEILGDKEILAGKAVTLQLSAEGKEGNIESIYEVRDFDDNIIVRQNDNFAVKDKVTVVRRLVVPDGTVAGKYVAALTVKSGDKVATAARVFSVATTAKSGPDLSSNNITYLLVTTAIVVLVILYLNYGRIVDVEKKREKQIQKIYKNYQHKKGNTEAYSEARDRLQHEMASLERAYKLRLISQDSYLKGKARIEEMIRKVKK